jgi:hypothetical protein
MRKLAVLLAALLPACGGGGSSVTAPPPPAPPAPVTSVLDEGVVQLGPNRVTWGNFQSAWNGRLEVVVDWTSAGNNLDVVLTRGFCDFDQLQAGACIVMGAAESPTAKPERIAVDNAVSGTFTLFVTNRGPGTDSFSYRAVMIH